MKLFIDASGDNVVIKINESKIEFRAIDNNKKQQILLEIDQLLISQYLQVSKKKLEKNSQKEEYLLLQLVVYQKTKHTLNLVNLLSYSSL